ncbi:MAG: SMP-30/gluconolactonase/LRE family protein [Balneolaceae bacterium]|nr:SMP-30/gluconolactonase/LRE family protein [Balneolaceae bacterium]
MDPKRDLSNPVLFYQIGAHTSPNPEVMRPISITLTSLLISLLFLNLAYAQESELVGEPELIADGFQFTEGPYWHPDGFLIFSDIPASIIYKWSPESGETESWIEPSGNSNGISARPDGTMLVAQHAGRVSEIDENRELVPIAEEFDGKRLNSPNDIAVRSDGLIYFTDPPFGVSDDDRELDISGVFRIDSDGSITLVYYVFNLPNAHVFTPD